MVCPKVGGHITIAIVSVAQANSKTKTLLSRRPGERPRVFRVCVTVQSVNSHVSLSPVLHEHFGEGHVHTQIVSRAYSNRITCLPGKARIHDQPSPDQWCDVWPSADKVFINISPYRSKNCAGSVSVGIWHGISLSSIHTIKLKYESPVTTVSFAFEMINYRNNRSVSGTHSISNDEIWKWIYRNSTRPLQIYNVQRNIQSRTERSFGPTHFQNLAKT